MTLAPAAVRTWTYVVEYCCGWLLLINAEQVRRTGVGFGVGFGVGAWVGVALTVGLGLGGVGVAAGSGPDDTTRVTIVPAGT